MPEISRFFGMVITMYYDDHAPPHSHARAGGDQIQVKIENWRRARREEALERIDGLG